MIRFIAAICASTVYICLATALGSVFGFGFSAIMFGYFVGLTWSIIWDMFFANKNTNQVQVTTGENTISIQARGNIEVNTTNVDR